MMLPPTMNRPPLAKEKVRFVGDIVAMVVAESKAAAMDAAETVIVDYDELPAVASIEAAIAEGAPCSCTKRRARTSRTRWAPARSRACSTTPTSSSGSASSTSASRRCRWSRVASSWCRATDGGLTVWVASQGPHGVRDELAMHLGIDPALIHAQAAARSAAASAPRQGMAIEHLLDGEGRAHCSAGP